MRVIILAAGAAGMYCGSCLRDNRLAATLIAQGRDVSLVPLYTPLRTDEPNASRGPVLFPGINAFLQQNFSLFRRRLPIVDRLIDSRLALHLTSLWAGATRADQLGELTVSMLRGEDGNQRKEVDKLVEVLRAIKPDLVNLPNLLLLGPARAIRERVGCKVVCTLSGEDLFVDGLPVADRNQVNDLIAKQAEYVDAFVAMTKYYAAHAAARFGLPIARTSVVRMGVAVDDFPAPADRANRHVDGANHEFTIGYLARICDAKGLMNLGEAFARLRSGGRKCRLRIAGFLPRAERPYWKSVRSLLRKRRIPDSAYELVGEVTREEKVRFLGSLDVLSVPANYPEAKGLSLLEAMAAGVPVVQPRAGSFTELVEETGGGLLYDPHAPHGLADGLERLMDDPRLRSTLADRGRTAVREKFNDQVMADETWKVYERIVLE